MHVNIYGRADDVNALIERCAQLDVTNVVPDAARLPGYAETGAPDLGKLRAIVGRLRDAGIRVPVAITWFGNDPDVVLNPAAHRAAIDSHKRTIAALGQAGIGTTLHYHDLALSEDPADDERYWDGLARVFGELVREAEAANVTIANHAIWRCLPDGLRAQALADGVTMADYRRYKPEGWRGPYLLTNADDIARLIAMVPSPNNGVCFCTGMHITGGDVPSLVDRFKGKIYYSQMRDVKGRWPAAEEVFFGSGDLDFPDILRRLDSAGYAGLIGPEHLGKPRYPGEDLEAAAVRHFQGLLAGLGRS